MGGVTVGRDFTIIADIDASLRRLETEKISDYRPLAGDTKPSHDDVRSWVRGFSKAMQLAPGAWIALLENEKTQPLIQPFVGFIDIDDAEPFEMRDDVDDLLDAAAALIPRTIPILRKIIRTRHQEASALPPRRPAKVGRNDACPCGSGKKYKLCCGQR